MSKKSSSERTTLARAENPQNWQWAPEEKRSEANQIPDVNGKLYPQLVIEEV
jgi:hypothetical protein